MRLIMMPDSVAHLRALFLSRTCVADEAPQALAEASGSHVGVVEYTTGIRPEERPLLPGYDDGVTALVTGIFVLLSISVSRHTTFLKTFASALLSGRRRSNTFDDHTVDETRITAALLLICCVCEGILIYFGAVLGGFSGAPFGAIASASGAAFLLLAIQTAAYCLIGYAFSLHQGDTLQWVRGFFASQALLGLMLTVPALSLIFYPGAAAIVVWVGVALYVIARLLFFGKGFRFFYTNLFSLLYFILYLCTVEIAPILFMWRMSTKINGFI